MHDFHTPAACGEDECRLALLRQAGYEVKQRFMVFTVVNTRPEANQVILSQHGWLYHHS